MHKLKKPEELIIEDKETRALLLALLGKWGDTQFEDFFRKIDILIQENVVRAETRLRVGYSHADYDEAINKGNQNDESNLPISYRTPLFEEATYYFQSHIGHAVGIALPKIMKSLAIAAGNQAVSPLESKVKAVKKLRERRLNHLFAEAGGISKPLGRRIAYKKADVQRRSIAIISAIKPGKRDKGKVAVTFYSDFEESEPFKKDQIIKAYNGMTTERRQLLLNKYNNLLINKKLNYEDLVSQATDNSRSRKRYK